MKFSDKGIEIREKNPWYAFAHIKEGIRENYLPALALACDNIIRKIYISSQNG